jgi:EAL domain-containing protein (putative c-di-GMP-specific phosphodiesterase class I)
MYTAKNRSKNELHFFTPDSSEGAGKRLELETCLRRALERHEFQMFYQPQVDLNGRLASLEALLVWDAPELGRVPPSEFIPIAEETGMILPIGEWALHHSCKQIASWRAAGLATVPLAVNVSALQFAQPDFVSTVADALSRAAIPADCLELELTESLIMRDVLASASRMRELREIGVKIAIDDFGTGYSSLSYLRRLPADALKIDQSFLQESEFGPATLALIKSIVVLAHNIGLSVTAEGIETAEQLQLIRLAGCDRAQGHLFGPGLPPFAVEELLRGR